MDNKTLESLLDELIDTPADGVRRGEVVRQLGTTAEGQRVLALYHELHPSALPPVPPHLRAAILDALPNLTPAWRDTHSPFARAAAAIEEQAAAEAGAGGTKHSTADEVSTTGRGRRAEQTAGTRFVDWLARPFSHFGSVPLANGWVVGGAAVLVVAVAMLTSAVPEATRLAGAASKGDGNAGIPLGAGVVAVAALAVLWWRARR